MPPGELRPNSEIKPERDIEKDKESFLKEVETSSVEEVATVFDEQSSRQLAADLENAKLFLLGEMHGVKENPNIIYTLFKKFGFRQLALEWDPKLKETVDRFLESGDIDFESIQESGDGLITPGHFALFKKLKEEGALEQIIFFNAGGESWNERDVNMAKNVLAGSLNASTLVVAGRLHTRVGRFNLEDEYEYHPMGENIRKRIPDAPFGEIKYLRGGFHNFGLQEFDSSPEDGQLSARFYRSDDGSYIFQLPEAHAALVPNPSTRLSE